MSPNYHETQLYTYAVFLCNADKIAPDNLARMRAKAAASGHTEGELLMLEADPETYRRTGKLVKP